MKIKIMGILVTLSLLLSTFVLTEHNSVTSSTVHNQGNTTSLSKTMTIRFDCSPPTIADQGSYNTVSVIEETARLYTEGKPDLPFLSKTISLPMGTQITSVTCEESPITLMEIPQKIAPSPQAVPRTLPVKDSQPGMDPSVYDSPEPYPSSWYTSTVGVGLDQEGKHCTFVTMHFFPVRYLPALETLQSMEHATLTLEYLLPTHQIKYDTEFDMVIITTEAFTASLEPFITHKNTHGIITTLKTVEEIVDTYEGRDAPEKIKYFIKYAIETWNITYVLLVGGLKSYLYTKDKDGPNEGTKAWHVPVRYTKIVENDEVGCISDLYYADVYKYDAATGQTVFEDWDPNKNGVFAEWPNFGGRDKLDLYPDVFYGRLACRTTDEVDTLVSKIINYESTSPEQKPWFKTMVGVGGKTFALYEGQPDGEYLCDLAIEYMGAMVDDPVRAYASNRDTGGLTPVPEDITQAISAGAGFVDFEGHGSPASWDTIWHDGEYPEDWTGGIHIYQFLSLSNGDKLPIVVVGGCHNAMFNVSVIKTMNFLLPTYWYHTWGFPTPVCFSWGLCRFPRGGAIAATGCTGYGTGYVGDPVSLSGELEANFFYKIGQEGVMNLGNAHGASISKFVAENTIGHPETHVTTIFQLFGDPSLKIGGYSN